MNFKRKCQHISGDTLQVFENQNWENVGHWSRKRHEEWWRRNTGAKVQVRNGTRTPGKGARKCSQWSLITLEEKGSQKLLSFWKVHTFIQITRRDRGGNTVPCLHYLKMSWFDSLVWNSQKVKMSCYRSAGGNAVRNFQATCLRTDPSQTYLTHLPSLIFTQTIKHKWINPANTQYSLPIEEMSRKQKVKF